MGEKKPVIVVVTTESTGVVILETAVGVDMTDTTVEVSTGADRPEIDDVALKD